MAHVGRTRVVLTLGVAQTLAWASTYYLPAILAAPIAAELGLGVATVFAAFSVGLVISAFLGTHAGRAIDRFGGRPVLATTNVLFAAGLIVLGLASGTMSLFAAWIILGAGMAAGLYEGAFATLVRHYGPDARNTITGITLIAGFASTVGWPLSAAMEAWLGWRGTCFVWAGLHLLLALPLNLSLPRLVEAPPAGGAPPSQTDNSKPPSAPLRSAILLSLVFAITWFISTAMAAHLPMLLKAGGATVAVALTAGALIGPAQVAGRLLEFGMLRSVHPLISARIAACLHPLGAISLALFGAPAAVLFALMHGAGNGILTISKGTLPLALFGTQGYGERQGLLMVPARLAQALSPWLFGAFIAQYGINALWISAGMGVIAAVALLRLAPVQTP